MFLALSCMNGWEKSADKKCLCDARLMTGGDCQNFLSGAEVLIGGQRSKPKREVFLTIESFVNIILRNLLAESKIRDNIP